MDGSVGRTQGDSLDWEAVGAIGEVVGSLVVLISLIILVVQVRGARTDLSTQITREIKRHNNEAFHQLIQRPDLIELHIRGQSEFDSLSDAEKVTWMFWLSTWINQTEDAWVARERGIPNMDWVDRYMHGVALVLRSDGGQAAWARIRTFFDEAFVEAIDRLVQEDDTTFVQATLG